VTELFRYEAETVDVTARDLPGLKGRYLFDHVPDGGVVLDVGCGGGKMLRTLALHRPSATLLGCDLKVPAEPCEDFDFRVVSSDGVLPYHDASVDTALIVDVLEHVADPSALLDEVGRVIRPGGMLVAFVPAEGQPLSFYRLFRMLLGNDLYAETKDHVQAFRRSDVAALLGPKFHIEQRRYAYHLFGHMMDATFCAMLRVPAVKQMFWTESPYHNRPHHRSLAARIFATSLIAANRVAWLESTLLARVPLTSAGILVAARRR
jgi:2-polyprenyl-3-methyl-5-hydroxy-6-metoxy-1,4-benzoquinol methylase